MTGTKLEIKFFEKSLFKSKGTNEKVETILNEVENNNIVIIEGGITYDEQGRLIEETMRRANQSENFEFSGIEYESFGGKEQEESSGGFLQNVKSTLQNDDGTHGLIVGNTKQLKQFETEDGELSAVLHLYNGINGDD